MIFSTNAIVLNYKKFSDTSLICNLYSKDYGKFNIRVNAARMGWIGGKPVFGYIDSMVDAGKNREDVVGEITDRIPLGIIPPEDDCAKAVLFFVSD